jgi:HK97 family phage major capsid protein
MDKNMSIKELRSEAREVLDKMTVLNTKVLNENREYTESETALWYELDAEVEEYKVRIEAMQERIDKHRDYKPSVGPLSHRSGTKLDMDRCNPVDHRSSQLDNKKVIHEMRALEKAVAEDDYVYRENGDSSRDAFNRYLKYGWSAVDAGSARNLQADVDTSGGFATVPIKIMQKLIHGFNNAVFLRQFATVIPVPDAMSLGAPEMLSDMGDLEWSSELTTGSEDTDLDFARRDLVPRPLARRIRVSNKFMRLSVLPPETLIAQRFEYVMGTVLESNYLNGTGANQPLGCLVASNDGISVNRDVSTHNTSGALKADNLIACVGELKAQHRRNARWILHRSTEEAVRKMKTGTGDYIWKPGLEKNPNTLLGFPIHLSEYAPDYDTISSGDYVAILGDFSWYWIIDALTLQVKRLDELYAESDQTGFIARYEGDGAPVLEDAFVRSQLA